ncbi:cell division protein FtsK SpoIIIE [Fructilactobacillus fructivorans]|nr:cell division protein FtsK SpoIIIE [Fructilactobacillus fructivorans]
MSKLEHYDGPAFYRKYFNGKVPFKNSDRKINDLQKPTKQLNKKVIHNDDSAVKQNHFSSRYQPKYRSNFQLRFKDDKKHYVESRNSLVERTKEFTPRSRAQNDNFYSINHSISKPYEDAAVELEKSDDDFVLYLDPKDPSAIPNDDLNVWDNDTQPIMKDNVNNNENIVDNSEAVDNSGNDKESPDGDRELGHSLADIFKEESGLAANLALFSDGKDEGAKLKSDESASKAHHDNVNAESRKEINQPNDVQLQNDDTDHHVEKKTKPVEEHDNSVIENSNDQNYHLVESNQGRIEYQFPKKDLLNPPVSSSDDGLSEWIEKQVQTLDDTLKAFGVHGHVVDWTDGPTVTQFQVKLELGVKVSKITNLTDDLKMALAAKDIRIEAPIPGKSTVGIEIPNPKPRPVMLSEILDSSSFSDSQSLLEVALGMSIGGVSKTADIQKMPHALIAGATGSGKSVFINSLLVSLLYRNSPRDLRMILIDPKAVELAPYNGIPHLLTPVVSDPKEASAALKWVTEEMDNRYERLAAAGVRNLTQYNQQAHKSGRDADKMPQILVVIDELADLMMVASNEVQDYIVRITQKARAAGIHLIVATQRPSVDIVTGTIKNNIPTRIAFMVSSQVDSRTIIDQSGAERLLGKGDMLYLGSGASQPVRLQSAFVTNQEVERVCAQVRSQETPKYEFQPKSLLKSAEQAQQHDDLWKSVLKYIAKEDGISTSKLQRVFSIGYNRAASIIDDLEQNNFISGEHGSKPRDVYLNEKELAKLNI